MRRLGMMLVVLTMAAGVGMWSSSKRASAAEDTEAAINRQFTGHWELVSFISFAADGTERDMEYIGRITYDGVGNMTAQGMPKDLPERAAQSSENVRGGFAYWGDVVYDVDNNIVIHKVKGSPSRGSWPGEDNIRYYEFDDGLLKLSMKDETGRLTGTLTWRKLTE